MFQVFKNPKGSDEGRLKDVLTVHIPDDSKTALNSLSQPTRTLSRSWGHKIEQSTEPESAQKNTIDKSHTLISEPPSTPKFPLDSKFSKSYLHKTLFEEYKLIASEILYELEKTLKRYAHNGMDFPVGLINLMTYSWQDLTEDSDKSISSVKMLEQDWSLGGINIKQCKINPDAKEHPPESNQLVKSRKVSKTVRNKPSEKAYGAGSPTLYRWGQCCSPLPVGLPSPLQMGPAPQPHEHTVQWLFSLLCLASLICKVNKYITVTISGRFAITLIYKWHPQSLKLSLAPVKIKPPHLPDKLFPDINPSSQDTKKRLETYKRKSKLLELMAQSKDVSNLADPVDTDPDNPGTNISLMHDLVASIKLSRMQKKVKHILLHWLNYYRSTLGLESRHVCRLPMFAKKVVRKPKVNFTMPALSQNTEEADRYKEYLRYRNTFLTLRKFFKPSPYHYIHRTPSINQCSR
ncbi:hypothetical protein NN561_008008 [Cricetulus griseus]